MVDYKLYDGGLSANELSIKFKEDREEDEMLFYSGDPYAFIHNFRDITFKGDTFYTKEEALEYCIKNSKEKIAIAVRVREIYKAKVGSQLRRKEEANARIKKSITKGIEIINRKILKKIENKSLITCTRCTSKVKAEPKYILRNGRVVCPVCKGSLVPQSDIDRIRILQKEYDEKNKASIEEREMCAFKQRRTCKNQWLVAGNY